MAEKREYVTHVLTQPARMFFSHLFEKGKIKGGNKEQWDLLVAVPNDSPDLPIIKRLAIEVFMRGSGRTEAPGKNDWSYPWETAEAYIARTDAEGKYENDWLRGTTLVKMHSLTREPRLGVFSRSAKKIIGYGGPGEQPRDAARNEFYPGRYVMAEFTFEHHAVGTNKPGTTLYLNSVTATFAGEDPGKRQAGGGRDLNSVYSEHVGHMSNVDPTSAGVAVTGDVAY